MRKSPLQRTAERRIEAILEAARAVPGLRRLGPKAPWSLEVQLISAQAMLKLNRKYRGKPYATDVLSFPPPEVFRRAGRLGELAICVPVLKRQAREHGHRAGQELEILLVHGVLHLLGLDHELGPREAARMARWESRLLGELAGRGLIERSRSGKRKAP